LRAAGRRSSGRPERRAARRSRCRPRRRRLGSAWKRIISASPGSTRSGARGGAPALDLGERRDAALRGRPAGVQPDLHRRAGNA
jgi:hypothetical protein